MSLGDAATGESGLLGVIDRFEVVPVVREFYTQIRAKRERCEELPGGASEGERGRRMSGPAKKPAASEQQERTSWIDGNLELIRQMGAPDYEPIAPDRYLFRLDPKMKLTQVAHQLHT